MTNLKRPLPKKSRMAVALGAEHTPGSFRLGTLKSGFSPKYYGNAFHPNGWQGFMEGIDNVNLEMQQHYCPDFRLVPNLTRGLLSRLWSR